MKLYLVQFDGESWYVEAASMHDAERVRLNAMRGEWESNWTGDEEPDSIALVHDEPVIRPHILAERPRIVCLCGSSRFYEAHQLAAMTETLDGKIVVGMGCFGHADQPPGARAATADGDERQPVKRLLDELHLRKIDLADEVLVLNVGGYIGESTAREIAYAKSKGRTVRYLEEAS